MATHLVPHRLATDTMMGNKHYKAHSYLYQNSPKNMILPPPPNVPLECKFLTIVTPNPRKKPNTALLCL